MTVITNEGIHVWGINNFLGGKYSYHQVKTVETGYYTRGREKGYYYYSVKMDNNKKIVITDCVQNNKIVLNHRSASSENKEEVNSYIWLEIVDGYIMENPVEKISDLASENNSYNYDKSYLELFRRIMKNRDIGE